MGFRGGDAAINRAGRPVSLGIVVDRLAQDAERAERAVRDFQRRTQAALLLGEPPPPLPADFPSPAEVELVRLNADLRHLRNLVETLRARLPDQPAGVKHSKRRTGVEDKALEQAEAALERAQREQEVALLSAGAALDRATPEETEN